MTIAPTGPTARGRGTARLLLIQHTSHAAQLRDEPPTITCARAANAWPDVPDISTRIARIRRQTPAPTL